MSSTTALSSNKLNLASLTCSIYALIALSAIVYAYLTYRADLVINHGHDTLVTFFTTHLIILLPEVIIWTIAARGALRLKSYATSVISSPDGIAFNYIANALLLLVQYSIIISMATTVKILFIHTSHLKEMTIFTSHLPLLFVLASSICLFIGSYKLNRLASNGSDNLRSTVVLASLIFLLVLIIAYIRYFYNEAQFITDDDGLSHFALSDGVLLFTYVLPHAITWLLGVLACLNLVQYAHNVDGRIYKVLLRDLYRGILIVFACTYIVQILYVSNISTKQFNPALLLIFGVMIILTLGYLLIYRGVRQLQRLEA